MAIIKTMPQFYDLWVKYANRAGFKTLNAFITKHDKSASAYQTTTKKLTGMPGRERVARWSELLHLADDEALAFQRIADIERVLVAKDGEDLGPGISMLMEEMDRLEAQLRERDKQVSSLNAKIVDLTATLGKLSSECARLGIGRDNPPKQA